MSLSVQGALVDAALDVLRPGDDGSVQIAIRLLEKARMADRSIGDAINLLWPDGDYPPRIEMLEQLDKAGFIFRGSTPLREINAALLRLNGAKP